jgi:hypothetical protein
VERETEPANGPATRSAGWDRAPMPRSQALWLVLLAVLGNTASERAYLHVEVYSANSETGPGLEFSLSFIL